MDGSCAICGTALVDKPTVLVKRGLDTIVKASIERQDAKISLLGNKTSIELHVQCRKGYVCSTSILTFKRKIDLGDHASIRGSSRSPFRRNYRSGNGQDFSYIENNDDCQFTLSELKDVIGDFDTKPDQKTIKNKLAESPTLISSLRNTDVLWIYAKCKEVLQIPGWNGFMDLLTQHEDHFKSHVMYLPFINSPANNYYTIYTTLLYVLEDSIKYGHVTCIITFDQPLYIKAKQIVASSAENSGISKIVARLRGFHMCVSFLGSIGFIMAGSGLKEVLSSIYASNSVDKILTGHAYSRAVRGHTLLLIALSKIIFSEMNLTSEEQQFMDAYLNDWHEAMPSFSKVEELRILNDVKKKYKNKCLQLKETGPTSKLWVQYLDMVLVLKDFIRAERMGDWRAYLSTIKRMIPYFHATGHFLYAKSAQLFIQDM
ncbi:hypothetical protein AVEN_31260-1 [Araneus ventricosus]|uniref:Uncharacterized protein n=1 Tax=Araneus ventricosus TaxID=182803 RepID=A0A4Y2CD60_ARAVE|nr:hypothetical protein AVEN_31260-1 [Araneus ventricosus]